MQKRRPTAVLVIAILHLVGGGFGLLGAICGGAQLAGGGQMFPQAGGAQANQQQEMVKEMEARLDQAIPQHKFIERGEFAVSLVLSVMMLAGGIGLLKMQSWARSLSILYAVLSILTKIFTLVYTFGFTVPVVNEFFDRYAKQNPGSAQFLDVMKIAVVAGVIIGSLFIIYPIIVLYIMLKPSIAAAFRGEESERAPGDEYDERDWGERDAPDDRFRGDPSR